MRCTIPSGVAGVSSRGADNCSPTLVVQWQKPTFFAWWKMLSEEGSAAVSIFFQIRAGGTTEPVETLWPYSARHSKTFMTTQRIAAKSKAMRESMSQSRGWDAYHLAHSHTARLQTWIRR